MHTWLVLHSLGMAPGSMVLRFKEVEDLNAIWKEAHTKCLKGIKSTGQTCVTNQ